MLLNQENLSQLSDTIKVPSYDPSHLRTGIVHIGVGGFHRSHQAYYLHQLIEKHKSNHWAVCGVGLREADRKMCDVLQKQDGLYALVTQYANGKELCEVIGSIPEYLLAIDDSSLVVEKMAHLNTKIVSLTITEGGYNFNPTTGHFNFENPDIIHELEHPDEPRTVYGFLTASLRKRRANGLPPFTVLSCDNIQHNGNMARNMVLAFTKKQDPELANWIAKEVAFPNSMVDRITPVTTAETIHHIKERFGVEDEWPVVCEPFIQWVIEDTFCNGRPPLEKLGVQFVPDVTPYEKMKIRLLNAGHSILGIPGAIHGHPTIDACMQDAVFAKFMRAFMDKEVTPILNNVAGISIEDYKDSLETRFSNPNIKDGVSRICSESSAKLPKFLIPTLQENLDKEGSIKYASFLLAAWCYYSDKGVNEKGKPLEIIDAQKEVLHGFAQKTEGNWTAFLEQAEIFGDIIKNERFINEYTLAVQAIYRTQDVRSLMSEYSL